MPCYQVRYQSVNLELADSQVVADALRLMKFQSVQVLEGGRVVGFLRGVQAEFQNGSLRMTGRSQSQLDVLKKEMATKYTEAAFRRSAQASGLQVRQTADGKFQAVRGRY